MRLPPPSVYQTWAGLRAQVSEKVNPGMMYADIVFLSLTAIAVSLRIYVRAYKQRTWLLSDTTLVAAFICAIGFHFVTIFAFFRHDWNVHIWYMPLEEYNAALKCEYAAKILFSFTAALVRASLLLFYYRLIRDTNARTYRWMLHSVMFFNIATWAVFTFTSAFLCSPVRAYWSWPLVPNQKCLDEGVVTITAGSLYTVCDMLVALCPIPIVMTLRMPLQQRIGVCILLGLGFLATTAGAVRTYYTAMALLRSWDVSWYTGTLWGVACLEVDIAIMCACAPVLKPILDDIPRACGLKKTTLGQDTPNTPRNGLIKPQHQISTMDMNTNNSKDFYKHGISTRLSFISGKNKRKNKSANGDMTRSNLSRIDSSTMILSKSDGENFTAGNELGVPLTKIETRSSRTSKKSKSSRKDLTLNTFEWCEKEMAAH